MAGFKNTFSKGLTTLNVKTSNFMEEQKLRTGISTKESEIEKLKFEVGTLVYENRNNFSMEIIADRLAAIDERYATIEALKAEIAGLAEMEKNILGQQAEKAPAASPQPGKIFCGMCGAANQMGYKFCEKCGSKLEEA